METLLAAEQEAGDFLESALPDVEARARGAASGEKSGDWIGRYKLLQQIGEGGCGVVYMAEQAEPVRRRVALKIIKPGMDSRSVIARFEAERQALALMDHPNIAKVFDAGATASGRPYFVMELVRGIKITTYCDEHKLSTAARLGLFIQVCQAVQHAHQKGIIHRDLKPSNILVTATEAGAPSPVVIDFGIAKATTNQRLTDKTLFTAFEMLIGTPAYMSPEQAVLGSVDVDTRTDIYSLGVLLYELLTGTTPFDAGELLKAGLDEVRRVIREQDPARPSARLGRMTREEQTTVAHRRKSEPPGLIRSMSGELDWIAMKALEKDRTRRYETASGLASDVKRFLANETVAARPPSAVYRFQKTISRHRLFFAGVGVVALMLLGSLTVVMASLAKERKARREADAALHQSEMNRTQAQVAAEKSRQAYRFLEEMLQGVGPSAALGRDTAMLREILDKAAARLGTELADQPAIRGELRSRIGNIYQQLALYPMAEEMDRAAVADYRQSSPVDEAALASALANFGSVLGKMNKVAEAEAAYREALAIRQKLLGEENGLVATTIKELAVVYFAANRFTEAEVLNERALAIREKLFGHDHLEVADSLNGRSNLLMRQHKLTEAEAVQREVLAVRRRLLPAEHPLLASSLYNLGLILALEFKLAEAEITQRESLAMRLRLYGPGHPDVINSQLGLQEVLLREKKLDEAEALLRQILPAQTKVLGAEHPFTIRSTALLTRVLSEQSKFTEAEASAQETLQLQRKVLGEENDVFALALELLAQAQLKLGKFTEAEANDRKVVAIRTKVFGENHPDTLVAWVNLADVLQQAGKLIEAESLARDATGRMRRYLDEHGERNQGYMASNYTAALDNLAKVLEAEGKTAEAAALHEEITARKQRIGADADNAKNPGPEFPGP